LNCIRNGSNTAEERRPSRPPALSPNVSNEMIYTIANNDPRGSYPNDGTGQTNQPGKYWEALSHGVPPPGARQL
jgi:hypothetical protein